MYVGLATVRHGPPRSATVTTGPLTDTCTCLVTRLPSISVSSFAWASVLYDLIRLYQEFTFTVDTSRTPLPLRTRYGLFLDPIDGIHLIPHKRT